MNLKNTYHLSRQRRSHENPERVAKEGRIKNTTLLPGRAIVARAEGHMTHLDIFANNIILLYGMEGDPTGATGILGF